MADLHAVVDKTGAGHRLRGDRLVRNRLDDRAKKGCFPDAIGLPDKPGVGASRGLVDGDEEPDLAFPGPRLLLRLRVAPVVRGPGLFHSPIMNQPFESNDQGVPSISGEEQRARTRDANRNLAWLLLSASAVFLVTAVGIAVLVVYGPY